jgi:aryl-alcohol dehydrogenase-like predicted oxidoreductase
MDGKFMPYNEKVKLGQTGLLVGRLGISSSYGAPAAAFEEAFERGCNYFTWGTFIKGRSPEMKKAIKNILGKSQRDQLVISLYTYAHNSYLTERFLITGLKELGIAYADVLILGYFPRRPSHKIIDGALGLKKKGLVRFLALTSHNRKVYPKLLKENIFDLFHIRYNAVHRGAEQDIFPYLDDNQRPGIVSFTATCWGKLLKQKKMPPGETVLSAVDCYRFVLSNPQVDVCMVGTKNLEQMREDLHALETEPLTENEMSRVKKIGDYIYQK